MCNITQHGGQNCWDLLVSYVLDTTLGTLVFWVFWAALWYVGHHFGMLDTTLVMVFWAAPWKWSLQNILCCFFPPNVLHMLMIRVSSTPPTGLSLPSWECSCTCTCSCFCFCIWNCICICICIAIFLCDKPTCGQVYIGPFYGDPLRSAPRHTMIRLIALPCYFYVYIYIQRLVSTPLKTVFWETTNFESGKYLIWGRFDWAKILFTVHRVT